MATRENYSDNAYSREAEVVAYYRKLANSGNLSPEAKTQALEEFTTHYERLLDDSKLLTSVGDRLQRKLKSANLMLREQAEEIKRANREVQQKNAELENTISELTKTRVQRRAQFFTGAVTFVLFIVSELLEDEFDSLWGEGNDYGNYLSWGVKIVLLAMFKPLESVTEKWFLRRTQKNIETERESREAEAAKAVEAQTDQPEAEPDLEKMSEEERKAYLKKKRAEERARKRAEIMAKEAEREKQAKETEAAEHAGA